MFLKQEKPEEMDDLRKKKTFGSIGKILNISKISQNMVAYSFLT